MSQVNDINVRIILTVEEDGAAISIAAATVKTIYIKKPSGTVVTATATFFTDGTEGKIYYDSVSGDINESGLYRVQGLVLIGGGTYYTSVESFRVDRNLV